MKIINIVTLISNGDFSKSEEYKALEEDVLNAIKNIENPAVTANENIKFINKSEIVI